MYRVRFPARIHRGRVTPLHNLMVFSSVYRHNNEGNETVKIFIDCPAHVDAEYYRRMVRIRLERGFIPAGTTSGIIGGVYQWWIA